MGSEYVLLPNGDFASVDALNHSGIKGMKWGIRRYQNKDGSLTAAGKKRYTAEAEKLKEREKTIKNQERVRAKVDKLNAKKAELDERQKALDEANGVKKSKFGLKKKDADAEEAKKSAKDMSDEELFRALNRARMETEYNRLTNPQQMNNNQQGNGQQQGKSSGMMAEMVKPAVVNAGRNFLQNALTKFGNKALEDKPDPNSTDALKKLVEKAELEKRLEVAKKGTAEEQRKKYDLEKEIKKDAAAAQKAADEAAAKARSRRQINRNIMDRASSNKASSEQNNSVSNRLSGEYDFTPSTNTSTVSKSNVSSGKSFVNSHGDTLFTFSDRNVNSGRSFVNSYGDTLFAFEDDD